MGIRVIADFSHHQGKIDFESVATDLKGAILKATQGTSKKDPRYSKYKSDAKAAGLRIGHYHFGEHGQPAVQAEFFLATAQPAENELVVLDIEEWKHKGVPQPPMTLAEAEIFVTKIHKALGRWPGVYGGHYLKDIVQNHPNTVLKNCWLWIAQYASKPHWPKVIWPDYTIWQYTDGQNGPPPHKVSGVGNCDRDEFNGTEAELFDFWGSGGIQKTGQATAAGTKLMTAFELGISVGPAGAASDFPSRAAEIADAEWKLFGKQAYDETGKLVRRGHKEGEDGFYQRVGSYWKEGTHTHSLDGRNHDWPWSAAFISWVMRKAGAGDKFRYSTQHSVYIAQGIRDLLQGREDAGFWTYRLQEAAPSVGDLVCWSRQSGIDYDHQHGGDYKGHTDLVVAVEQDVAWVTGGNVGNSVTRRPLLLEGGQLVPTHQSGEILFALMKCRIP